MAILKFDPSTTPNATSENIIALDAMVTNNRLLWLKLCGQTPLASGYFDSPVIGTTIQAAITADVPPLAQYVPLFLNRSSNPVGIMVYGTFSAAGMIVKISQNSNTSDESVLDYLGSAAGAPAVNKRISNSMVVLPNQTIYIASGDVGVALTANELFRVLVFDPARYMNDSTWEARR